MSDLRSQANGATTGQKLTNKTTEQDLIRIPLEQQMDAKKQKLELEITLQAPTKIARMAKPINLAKDEEHARPANPAKPNSPPSKVERMKTEPMIEAKNTYP